MFITPHIGSFVADNRARCFQVVRENLTTWVNGGQPKNRVEHGY